MGETRDIGTLKLGLQTAFEAIRPGIQMIRAEIQSFRDFVKTAFKDISGTEWTRNLKTGATEIKTAFGTVLTPLRSPPGISGWKVLTATISTGFYVAGRAAHGMYVVAHESFVKIKSIAESVLTRIKNLIMDWKTAIVGALSAFLGLRAVKDFAIDVLKTGDSFERWSITMNAMIPDLEQAKKTMGDIVAFADRTPFLTSDIREAGKLLVAFNVPLDQIEKKLTTAGSLAAAFGINIGDVVAVMGRIQAGGMGEAFEALRRMGITKQSMMGAGLKFDESGELISTAEEAMAALDKLVETRFPGIMDKMSLIMEGRISTIMSKWGKFKTMIAQSGFLDTVTDSMGGFLDWIGEQFESGKAATIAKKISGFFENIFNGLKFIIASTFGMDQLISPDQGGKKFVKSPQEWAAELGIDESTAEGIAQVFAGTYEKGLNTARDKLVAEGAYKIIDLDKELAKKKEVDSKPPWAQAIVDAINWIKEQFKEFKDAFDTGGWEAVGEKIGTMLTDATKAAITALLDDEGILAKVLEVGKKIGGALASGVWEGMLTGYTNLNSGIDKEKNPVWWLLFGGAGDVVAGFRNRANYAVTDAINDVLDGIKNPGK
jgi:hypothetical protein